jgi:DNA polymerase-1
MKKMNSELIIIDDIPALKKLVVYLVDKDFVAFDTETTGLTRYDEIIGFSVCASDEIAYYVILASWNKDLNKLVYCSTEFKSLACELIRSLVLKSLIMHNGVFDCYMVEAYFKINLINSLHTDTMILAHLLNENRRVGLKELAGSMYGESSILEQQEMKESVLRNGGKLTKKQYEMYKCDVNILGKYGAKDTLLTYKLFYDLVSELIDSGLYEFFYNEESMPLLRGPTYDMNIVGLQADTEKLTSLQKQLEAECEADKNFIYSEIAESIKDKYPDARDFNINANQQLAWLLFERLNLQFGNLTKSGRQACKDLGFDKLPYTYKARTDFILACKNSTNKKYTNPWKFTVCDKSLLSEYSNKYIWIKRLLEYKKKEKLLKTYVIGIKEKIEYGVIYPSFLQHGTSSGRYSSRSPNFQNLPRDDKRIKACITARKKRVFVAADYSQLEPRIFASISGDERLLSAFNGNSDFYSIIGIEVYEKMECVPLKEGPDNAFGVVHPKLRQDAKVFSLAATYGATGAQLAPMMKKHRDEVQEDIYNYFEKFPKVAEMMLNAHAEAKNHGEVLSLFGRPRRIPEAKNIEKFYGKSHHHELPYNARKLLNLAVNHKIQSTAASIVNRAAIKLFNYFKEAEINAKIILQVHDSIVVECLEEHADSVSMLLRDAMENTTQLKNVRLEAIPKIGYSLSEV